RQRLLAIQRRPHRLISLSCGPLQSVLLLVEHCQARTNSFDRIDRHPACEQLSEQLALALLLPVPMLQHSRRGGRDFLPRGFTLTMLARERALRALQSRVPQGQKLLQIARSLQITRSLHDAISCRRRTVKSIGARSSKG